MFDKRLMQMCPESKKYIAGNIILQWIELLFNCTMMISISLILQDLYYSAFSNKDIYLLIVTGLSIIARAFTTRYAVRMSYMAAKTVKLRMRQMIYSKLIKLGSSYRENVTTAELVQESVEGVDQLESYFGQYVPQFFYAFIAPVTLFLLFGFSGSWSTASVLLICVPLMPGTIMMVQKIAKKILAKYWGEYTELGSTFLENLQGMTTLKIYQADEYRNIAMNEESERFRRITMKVLMMQLNSIIIMDFFTYGGAAAGIILATRAFIKSGIPLANAIFMILLSAEFFLPMRKLGSYFHVAMNGMAASDRIFNFLSVDEPEAKELTIGEDTGIQIIDLSFSYDKDEVLTHVDMDIPAGSFTGIVGESGSGKSTLASLVMGRNTAPKGCVFIGGNDIGDIDTASLMQNITYVGHSSFFFKGTVRDNLTFGRSEASDEKLIDVLDSCGLKGFFEARQGLDTLVGENACELSGGQKQRLALARAVLHDSSIYIFDEATSNIDIDSESIILSRIKEIAREKTVVMISHRLANVTECDRIYVLADGRVSESGTHDRLIEANGMYSRLWGAQDELEHYYKKEEAEK